MNFFRSVCVYVLVSAALLYCADRASKRAENPLSVEETALSLACGVVLSDGEVFQLISLGRGAPLRRELEKAYSDARRGKNARAACCADFSGLTATVMEQDAHEAEVLVSGEIRLHCADGRVERNEGGMVVRLVDEQGIWRVW